jgi:hypothetical protein
MRNIFRLLVVFFCALPSLAQTIDVELKPIAREIAFRQQNKVTFAQQKGLFTLSTDVAKKTTLATQVADASVLELQPQVLQNLVAQKTLNLELTVPTTKGNLELQLYEADIYNEGFAITTSDGQTFTKPTGQHYRGIIKGDNQSLAAISIYENEVMGMVADKNGTYVLGRTGNSGNSYVFYNDKNLKNIAPPECFTDDSYIVDPSFDTDKPSPNARVAATKCLRIYWEADYPIYTDKGSSTTNVINYLTGLFNQSKIIYDNDGITVSLAQIFVWTSPSPYGSGSSSDRLNKFRTYRTSFTGDIAHLLSYGGGGGIAYVNAVCSSGYRYGYSGINSDYSNVPTYSWSVMVVTHEQGHIMGSPHTHSCSWNGNNTAIDNCVATQGGCPSLEGPAPSGGGTIMSYCHLTSTGINVTKGFGPQPRQLIINTLNSASCLSSSCGSTPPTTIANNAIYKIIVSHSNQLIDVNGGGLANGDAVLQWPNNNGTNQQWRAVSLPGGFWRFVNINSGKSLQVRGYSNANLALIEQWDWEGSYYQQWSLSSAGGGYFYLINRGSGLALDVANNSLTPGDQLIQYTLTNGLNQQWRFELVSAATPEELAASPESISSEGKLSISPNPATAELKVIFYSAQAKEVLIEMYNVGGKKVYAVEKAAKQGKNEIGVAVPDNAKPGMYIIRVENRRAKVVIQK